jgi:hypothetical protein
LAEFASDAQPNRRLRTSAESRIKRFGFAIFDSCVLVEEAAAVGSQAKNRIVWCVSPPRIWKEKKRKQTHANVILGGEGRVEGVLSS